MLLLYSASVRANDLRLIGTNLYDFTLAGDKCVYRIRGQVSQVFTKAVQVGIPTGVEYERVQSPPISSAQMDSSDMLQALVAMKMSTDDKGNSRTISVGQYFSLNSAMRQHFTSVTKYATVYVLNYPKSVNVGQPFDYIAIPTKDKGYYDCGITFTGGTNQFSTIRVVFQDRIIIRTNLTASVSTQATNISAVITNK